MLRSSLARAYSTAVKREGWLYIDSVLPIQLGVWDLRRYVGLLRQEELLDDLRSHLDKIKAHDFQLLKIEPYRKDGGVFVKFSYSPPAEGQCLQTDIREDAAKHGPLPNWVHIPKGDIWVVKGSPWLEDMSRFVTPNVKVTFDGPDVKEESLYELFRPYGRIKEIDAPVPVPAGTPRSSTVTFRSLQSATVARNVLQGFEFNSNTRFRTGYNVNMQERVVRTWLASHPKIVLPILIFLLGSLTYTVFDPIRSLMVEAKLLNWFDYKKYGLYKFFHTEAVESSTPSKPINLSKVEWKDRKEAETTVRAYLSDFPTTIVFIHGPPGSGKTTLLDEILKTENRTTLFLDCAPLLDATSDQSIIDKLAKETGYWPVFSFVSSMNSLIDLASVGLIGQKAGLSSSLPEQLKQVFAVVTEGLQSVSSRHKKLFEDKLVEAQRQYQQDLQNLQHREAILQGTYHDGRLDCVAGNGVMSELGIGDEPFDAARDGSNDFVDVAKEEKREAVEEAEMRKHQLKKQRTEEDQEAINSLPIVIIRNYTGRMNRHGTDEVLNAIAEWAAKLAEQKIAHVLVLSENRDTVKRVAQALPTKPITFIGLSDADSSIALSFVKQKLQDSGRDVAFSSAEIKSINRLGGRASDLESLIHKVRNGMDVETAVEDLITRGVIELRKNAFGDEVSDAKSLPWSREQAWKIVKLFSKSAEAPYYDILMDFPFKGDEAALWSMERSDLITIVTQQGRPSSIRPGKPLFRTVFERLANDRVFAATQEVLFNEKQISEAESKIKTYEAELHTVRKTMKNEQRAWYDFRKSRLHNRARYVDDKLAVAQKKVDQLERKNKDLKKTIADGDRR